jgi:hypothetical protein
MYSAQNVLQLNLVQLRYRKNMILRDFSIKKKDSVIKPEIHLKFYCIKA